MLSPIVQYGALLRNREVDREGSGRFATVVDGPGAGIEDDIPACIAGTPAPVHIIAVHKQTFVEQPHLIQRFAANHREAAHDDIDGQRTVVGEIEHMFAGKETGALKDAFQPGGHAEVVPQRRKPATGALLGHVRIEHPRPRIPDFWVLIEEIRERIETA